MDPQQRIQLEALAVVMFESFLRQQATEGRGKSIQDWLDLKHSERHYWRREALAMAREDFDPERIWEEE